MENRKQVYEIGYLLIPSIPQEKVSAETDTLKEILSKKEVEIIGQETPELRPLSYAMVKKIGTSNHKFDEGYFGWFKFEASVSDIESIKKAFEENPHMLRTLVITTVKENTYLGKKSPASVTEVSPESPVESIVEQLAGAVSGIAPVATPASVEEMDKSIDAMVKEA